MRIKVRAYAKLNLYLDITGLRDNGFHNLQNVTQTVSVYDTVTIEVNESTDTSCTIRCSDETIPTDEKNTAYKAAVMFMQMTEKNAEIKINIEKNVPVMGGMGGSSVDCAAVLYGLNELYGNPLSLSELCKTGSKLGADVPICIKGGTIFDDEEKENHSIISDICDCYFVCIQPDFRINTKDAFALYDRAPTKKYDTAEMLWASLKDDNSFSFCKYMYNIFEILHSDSRIEKIKSFISETGAVATLLTGSGSVVYGIYDSKEKAEKAEMELKKLAKYKVFSCHNVNNAVETVNIG